MEGVAWQLVGATGDGLTVSVTDAQLVLVHPVDVLRARA
jgi:hypothetical protein